MRLRLSLACGDYDRTRALADGRVRADGADFVVINLGPEEMFFRQLVHSEFDVCEISLSSYTAARSAGDDSMIAVPAFPSRCFRHSSVFINTDSGVVKPQDLVGRRIGVAEWQQTANVWIRGILQDRYDVPLRSVRWVQGGLEQPGRREKVKISFPTGVDVDDAPPGRTLSEMLLAGEIDAVITPRMPSAFTSGARHIRRLFPDYASVETDYYRDTGIFPIMHTMAIRKDVYLRDRWLAQALTKAMEESKRVAMAALYETAALPVMVPWIHGSVEQARDLIGEDWWPYGFEANRVTLTAFLRYATEQGIASDIDLESLFAPETLDTFRI